MITFDKLLHLLLEEDLKDEPNEGYGDMDPDFEKGETNFPYGHGYPNIKKHWNNVVNLEHIFIKEKTDQEKKQIELKQIQLTKRKIQEIIPALFKIEDLKYKLVPANPDSSPFPWGMCFYIDQIIEDLEHMNLEGYENNSYYNSIKQVYEPLLRADSNCIQHLTQLKEFVSKMCNEYFNNSPEKEDINNQSNYPVYVSLYDITRAVGGHEEGGWWYDVWDLVKTVTANNFEEVKKISQQLYSIIKPADINGQPRIIVEETPGTQSNKPTPYYS